MRTAAGAGGRVRPVELGADLPVIEVSPGAHVRHLVGQRLMFREVALDAGATLTIDETEQEHVLVVRSGTVRVTCGVHPVELVAGRAAVLPPGRPVRLATRAGSASLCLSSTPPHAALVRDLVHLECADHGFE